MTTLHTLRLVTLAGLTPLFALNTLAQEVGQAYGGISAGPSRVKVSDVAIANAVIGTGLTTSTLSNDTHDTGYKVFGGYQISPYFAVEAGYFRLGTFSFDATTTPAGTLTGKTRIQGLNADLVGVVPVGGGWSGLARAGVVYGRTRDTFTGTPAVVITDPVRNRNDTNMKLGLGVQYAFSNRLSLRLEGERYRYADPVTSHGHVDLITASLVIPFGGGGSGRRTSQADSPRDSLSSRQNDPANQAAMAAQAASPTPMPTPAPAVAEAPAPAVVAVAPLASDSMVSDPNASLSNLPPTGAGVPLAATTAPPVAMQQDEVSPPPTARLASQLLFGFDQSTVRPEGRRALDALSQSIASTRYEQIQVEGHTDRIGTPEYNQALSLQRAESVKSYLVTNGKLDAQKIATVGKGSSMPLTRPDDCKGTEPSATLETCLQKDRRVDVNVTTTR